MLKTLATPLLAIALAAAVPAGPVLAQVQSTLPDKVQGTYTGQVVSVDVAANTITLDNGETYELPEDHQAEGITPGNKVTLHWYTCGEQKVCDVVNVVLE